MSAREDEATGPWLDARQLAAWRGFMTVSARLTAALDAQLERDSQLSFTEYYVLALLSEERGRRMRMGSLAARANIELSRLSHLVGRLEKRGQLLRREPDPSDRRCTVVILTDDGHAHLAAAAPHHVMRVRELFIDPLEPEELQTFIRCAQKVAARIEERS